MDNNIFNDDPFRNEKTNLNKLENYPLDGPFDGKRRKYPKIKEEQSSYEGEQKDGKRDGFGLLYWGDDSKFMGLFEEYMAMENYGMMMAMYIKDFGKNFKLMEQEI